MANGRTDEQGTLLVARAPRCRLRVWGLFGETHLGQRSSSRVEGRTHDRTRSVSQIKQNPLRSRGRSLIAPLLSTAVCFLLFAVAVPGSRFSPRSASAAATSGPKHRRCNVHNGLTCTARGPRPSVAASLHPRGGQLAPAPACRASGSRQGLVRRLWAAPTSGTARRTARCCAGSPTACGPRRRAPCRSLTASRSPAPSPLGVRPA